MSIAFISESIDYPESDGEPMGETDLHRDWMVRILEILRHRYRGQRVYIASDLLVYYEEGVPAKFVVPDDFIVLDCDPGRRRIFKTWEEKRAPDVVFEVTSHSSRRIDTVKKPVIYEQMGVKEYFIYDPTSDYLKPALQGFRLIDGYLTQIVSVNEVLRCETLQLGLRLVGGALEFFDLQTSELAVDEAESERAAKESERAAKELERDARERVEAKNRELLLEIEQLKRRLGEGPSGGRDSGF